MSRQSDKRASRSAFPMDKAIWHTVSSALDLSPQQKRIAERILCGQQDQEIASELGLSVPTVRTYLKRVYDRTESADRLGLVLQIFKLAQEAVTKQSHI